MREILFKAKRIDNSEWVYWNIFGELCRKSGKGTRLAIHNGATISYYDYIHQIRQFISTDTICQYTGLTDKNGNKIWENDICSTDIKRPYAVVEFRNGCFMYNLNDVEWDYYDIMMPVEPLVDSDKYTEVIGNIFDNPELLERNRYDD